MVYGDNANIGKDPDKVWWISIFNAVHWSSWTVCGRCVTCGRGVRYAKKDAKEKGKTTGDERWLCDYCGADWSFVVKWVGRACWEGRSGEVWQWLPMDRLPPDVRPADAPLHPEILAEVEKRVAARLDAEFEARVRAAVETELALRACSPAPAPSETP